MATSDKSSGEVAPKCIFEFKSSHGFPPFIDFQSLDGRVYGFPYAHLLHYVCEKNPDYASTVDVPPDRFSIAFSTHNVVLLGWRLAGLLHFFRYGKVLSVVAISSRYYGLSKDEPFIGDIRVSLAQKD